MDEHRMGTGTSAVVDMGTETRMGTETGTRTRSGREENRRTSARNRTSVVDAIWKMEETWMERGKT